MHTVDFKVVGDAKEMIDTTCMNISISNFLGTYLIESLKLNIAVYQRWIKAGLGYTVV